MKSARGTSERRAELLLNDLLSAQGWNIRRPPIGELLLQNEYASFSDLHMRLTGASKKGKGGGYPEAIVFDAASERVLAVIEAKKYEHQVDLALTEAQQYASHFIEAGYAPLAIGLGGNSDDLYALRVSKWQGKKWVTVTYAGHPISWIPNRDDLERVSSPHGPSELRPTVPPPEVLASRAEDINRNLREAKVKDEFRPAVVASIMLALASSKGKIRRDPVHILGDINSECSRVFAKAGKPDLGKSLHVDEANGKLATKAIVIAKILEKLNVSVLTAEHDYLGQLYETFFRYTGGNTIGQYFTPRHIARLMVDACDIGKNDTVLDPACGSGGFLVATMDRLLRVDHLSRSDMVKVVKRQLYGFETEPVTAALCVANMILRGDGSTRVYQEDCFTSKKFPVGAADVVLMNPPFPHKKTDTPSEAFVERGLEGLRHRGKLAVILPTSLLVKKDKAAWRKKILTKNNLQAVCQLPDELFQPYAAATTSVVILEKGVKHDPAKPVSFVRLHHDGYTLKKGIRVKRPGGVDDIPRALKSISDKATEPGFSGVATIALGAEWAPGAYVPSAVPGADDIRAAVDEHLRRLASFYTRYAMEVVTQRKRIESGAISIGSYKDMVSSSRVQNAHLISKGAKGNTIGALFDLFYGMKELHSREGFSPGDTLIISPTEAYNGCYGWLDFDKVIAPSFVTVAQTGSIGEAFVQFEPCAVNDDCLVLLPRKEMSAAKLVIAAACLHEEKWRFSYGRKLTPARIADFVIPNDQKLERWVATKIEQTKLVVSAALSMYSTSPSNAFYAEH